MFLDLDLIRYANGFMRTWEGIREKEGICCKTVSIFFIFCHITNSWSYWGLGIRIHFFSTVRWPDLLDSSPSVDRGYSYLFRTNSYKILLSCWNSSSKLRNKEDNAAFLLQGGGGAGGGPPKTTYASKIKKNNRNNNIVLKTMTYCLLPPLNSFLAESQNVMVT